MSFKFDMYVTTEEGPHIYIVEANQMHLIFSLRNTHPNEWQSVKKEPMSHRKKLNHGGPEAQITKSRIQFKAVPKLDG